MTKQILSEIKFALENGFTNVERIIEADGGVAYKGSFGYVVADKELEKEIEKLINPVTKKLGKLTPKQQEVMDSIYKAIPSYHDLTTARWSRALEKNLYNEISQDIYIDGENLALQQPEKEEDFYTHRTHSTYLGGGVYAHTMSTKTLEALEKKGYINIVKVGGDVCDLFTLNENVEAPVIYKKLVRFDVEHTSYSEWLKIEKTTTETFYCPVGQEESAMKAFEKRMNANITKVLKKEVVKVGIWTAGE